MIFPKTPAMSGQVSQEPWWPYPPHKHRLLYKGPNINIIYTTPLTFLPLTFPPLTLFLLLLLLLLTTTPTTEKAAKDFTLHPLHGLILHLLFLRRHLLQPLLAVLANLLVQHLVLPLPPLPHLIHVRFPLLEALAQTLLAHHAGASGAAAERAQQPSASTTGPALPFALFVFRGELLLHAFSGDAFAVAVFRGDVRAGEGFEDVADVGEAHGGDVFEEGDEGDEFGVIGGAFPFREDDRVGRLEGGVGGVGVEEDGAGEGPVEVVEILTESKVSIGPKEQWIRGVCMYVP